MGKAEEAEVKRRVASDPLAQKMQQAILREAERVLEERTCRYDIPDGRRLLRESRLALHHIGHCVWAWRFTGREEYKARAIREMEAACELKDWNPAHFLDTAEMSLAVAWGYDWLHDELNETQRDHFAEQLIAKGLRPAAESYEGGAWWAKPKNNWAQVCGSGIALAAMAVAEADPKMAGMLVERGVRLMESCHSFYKPDGMYPEGPGYWHYGTNYHVKLLAACERLGVAYEEDPVLAKAGSAVMHLLGNSGMSFNFADAKPHVEVPSYAQCWIASHFHDPVQTAHVRRLFSEADGKKGANPLSLLWLPVDPGDVELPKEAVFRGGQPVAVYRTSWEKNGVWFAIKGGTANVSHGQMDVGSFVYDAHGVRWFHDLGADDYGLPGYFSKKRWDYFRMQNRSHNTLEINGELQDPMAKPGAILSTESTISHAGAKFDLTNAYAGSAGLVTRGVRFDKRTGEVRLVDMIDAAEGEVVWRAFTDAKAEVRGNEVILTKSGVGIAVRNSSGIGEWTIAKATPPSGSEDQNEGFIALMLAVPAAERVSLKVELLP